MSFHSYAEYILKLTNKQQNKLIEEDNRLVVTGEEEGRGKAKWIKGVNCMAMVGNQTFGGEYAIVYTISNYNVIH